ncbi:ABC transporter ATP-binding protein [Paenibacillus baekrokdamisoli]|uniref:ABC transporter ATP-binding protein n=1 Tax=Paenibacillus baekrokdamisoli TaxID=1712516 RepID=A0A3G9IWL7_9BACL|nr:ABC transporter ATP-binding protein [Paenibacillus baekrokdamisoli]MBB3072380.1 ATP-binding cassette subfamily B protein [Paenibacillus baekrokdamisoli]BBH23250.1 ABC transporter ATP-binding protein [Paenibacillus baekrokdamisoli]
MKRLRDDIFYIFKGLKEIHRIRPWLLTHLVIRGIFEAITPFINIYMSALIIDGINDGETFQLLMEYAGITISLNLIVALLIRLMNRFIQILKEELNHKYEMVLSQKIIDMDYTSIENPETHRLREKIKDIRNMSNGGIWLLVTSFQELIKCLFVIIFSVALTFSLFTLSGGNELSGIYSFVASPIFSLILGVCILANVIISMYANATVTKKMHRIMNEVIPFNRIFGYYINSYLSSYHAGKDIRIYNQKGLIESESMALFGGANVTLSKLSNNQMKYSGITTTSTVIITTLIYLFVGLKALAGLFGIGSIIRYVGSINEFTGAFTSFMNQLAMMRANNESMKVFFDFLDIPSQMYQGTLPVEKRALCHDGDNDYEIEFRKVSFKYPSSENYTLRDVSLKLKIGERLAVVGMNGSGKTTLIKLLCRLYDPTEGEILLNGINIKKYNYDEYMSIFSVVFQDFKLFSFSLGQNVAAKVDYDKAKVEAFLAEAGFGERYNEMPDGTETCLYKDFDENGVEISGGEAQKIALARALYKEAPFIILDEPTAALDPIAEYEIYSKFNEIVGNKTAIYISHRLSSCRFCDDIAVFHEGKLIQRGSHEELVSKAGGKYHELWYAQAQYYAVTSN